MSDDALYYEDVRPVFSAVNCINAENLFNRHGALLLSRGKVIDSVIALYLERHDIIRIKAYRKLTDNYSCEKEVVQDILLNFRSAVRGIVGGHEMDVQMKDKLFDILFYLNKINSVSILSYIKHIEKADNFTYLHSLNLSWLVIRIGVLMNLSGDDLKDLMQAGLFHDIGKVSIPYNVLGKKGKLTDEEFRLIKNHPTVGYSMVRNLVNERIALGILQHHEKLNGTGYPNGLKGDEITLFARILSVADIFEALIAERPYKSRFTYIQALHVLRESAFKGELDYQIVDLFSTGILDGLIGATMLDENNESRLVIGYNKNTLKLMFMS